MRSGRRAITKVLLGLGVLTGSVGFSQLGHASVSGMNGNFFVVYTDIVYNGGFEPKIERVYNSKTPYKGIFGWGWGNEYEAYLNVSADGSVVVHEYGGGAENRFSPNSFSAAELNKAVEMIAEAEQKAGAAGTAAGLAAIKTKLRNDAVFRNDEWEKFRARGLLKPRELPIGTQLHSNRFSYQYLTRVQDGYVRNFDSGQVEKFNDVGKLIRISDKNNNFIEITYGKDGHPQKLVDNFNRKMFFTFNDQGLLATIEGENGKKAEYQYNGYQQLVRSKDVDGNTYTFKYDNHHNMTEIGYSDKTTMVMTYHPRTMHENIKSVKERDGTLTEYKYTEDGSDPGHRSTTVLVKTADGKLVSTSMYEYFMKRKASGEEWNYKLITVLDGDRTETTYNECCGLPLIIKHGKDETTFQYDSKGHVTHKETPSEITDLHYDPKAGKVDKVTKISKLNRSQVNWAQFQYDDKANLVFAKNSEGKGVKLIYDMVGRIRTMVDQERHQISFKYNENSKPVEITDPAVGTITVTYTNSGEIKKVDSTAGRKIALQVTSAFQNLLDIIRPAGVTLSF